MRTNQSVSRSYLFLLLLLQPKFIYGHWICDLAQVPCDASRSSEMCVVQNMNAWHQQTSAKVVTARKKWFCAMKCIQDGCLCALYEGDRNRCFLAFGETLSLSSSGLLEDIGMNAALEKPVYAPGEYWTPTETNYARYAVDGLVTPENRFFQSSQHSNPWLLVDLEQPFQIKAIKLICRQDRYVNNRFLQVAVMFGNTLITDGDFSSYIVATVVPGPNPGRRHWLFLRPMISGNYQYVVLQRQATYGFFFLDIAELQIFV